MESQREFKDMSKDQINTISKLLCFMKLTWRVVGLDLVHRPPFENCCSSWLSYYFEIKCSIKGGLNGLGHHFQQSGPPQMKICMHSKNNQTKQFFRTQWCETIKITELLFKPCLNIGRNEELSSLGQWLLQCHDLVRTYPQACHHTLSLSCQFHLRPSIPWPLTNYSIKTN